MKHPAQYTPEIVHAMIDKLGWTQGLLLDPFAGMGGALRAFDTVPGRTVMGVELERAWADAGAPYVKHGDATNLRSVGLHDDSVDMICTSPTYGNRMADHDQRKNLAQRPRSYTHDLRASLGDEDYQLGETSTARHRFHAKGGGENDYKRLHAQAWRECTRVAAPGCMFLLNVSDYYRTVAGKRVRENVTLWHLNTLTGLGWEWVNAQLIRTPRMRYGSRATGARVDGEWLHELRWAGT